MPIEDRMMPINHILAVAAHVYPLVKSHPTFSSPRQDRVRPAIMITGDPQVATLLDLDGWRKQQQAASIYVGEGRD